MDNSTRTEQRRRIAVLVRDLYDNRIKSSEFFRVAAEVDASDDPELRELLGLLRHEPANTWLFGVSGEAQRHNAARIAELVKLFSQ